MFGEYFIFFTFNCQTWRVFENYVLLFLYFFSSWKVCLTLTMFCIFNTLIQGVLKQMFLSKSRLSRLYTTFLNPNNTTKQIELFLAWSTSIRFGLFVELPLDLLSPERVRCIFTLCLIFFTLRKRRLDGVYFRGNL